MNKIEIKFLGQIWADIEYKGKTTKLPILITQRSNITPLLGVNWLKQLPITFNIIRLDEPINQSDAMHTKFSKLFETNHTNKTRMLPNPSKSQTDTVPFTKRCKKLTRPIYKMRTSRTITNSRGRVFRNTRSNYSEKRQDSENRIGRPKSQRQLCEEKTKHAKDGRITEPKICRTIQE